MSENVIVLPGTRWQVPLIKRLKKEGYRVVVFDLYEDQPAYSFADEYRIIDILDKHKCLNVAKEYNPIAILSDECDIAVPTIAWMSKQLGKPSIGIEMSELYTNKYKMRIFAKENGFDIPKFYKCKTKKEAINIFNKLGKKMIIKPLDANSSRGVYSIEKKEDIEEYFDKSIIYSKQEKSVLLEEYIYGEEFSVDGIKIDSSYYTLGISKKNHYDYNENLDQSLIFSFEDPMYDYNLLRKTNREFVESTGITFGLTHAEYKYQNGKFYLIEIGARGGGNLISSIINYELTGIDSQKHLIEWAVKKNKKTEKICYRSDFQSRYAVLEFFDTRGVEGKIEEIKGESILKEYSEIKSYEFFFKVGDNIGKAKDAGTRFGYYIVCCSSKSHLDEIVTKVRSTIKIRVK